MAITFGAAIRLRGAATSDPAVFALLLGGAALLWIGAGAVFATIHEPTDEHDPTMRTGSIGDALTLLRDDPARRGGASAMGSHSGATGEPVVALSTVRRDMRLLALTFTAANLDAVSYLGLGHVFPANMTGNTVLLGLGLASRDYAASSRSATALAAFLCAAAIVGSAPSRRGWSRTVTVALTAEMVLLGGLTGWWLAIGDAPDSASRFGLIALAGCAMGAQSAAVRRLHVSGVATTYITGTWTALSTGVGAHVARGAGTDTVPDEPTHRRQAVVLGCYVTGALIGGLLYRQVHAAAVIAPLVLLAAVVGDVAVHRSGPTTPDRH